MLHLICGNYGAFTEDPEFIRHPDDFFDYYFEDEWFYDPFVRRILTDIDHLNPEGDIFKVLFEERMLPSDISTGSKNLVLCKYFDRLNNYLKMGKNCHPYLMEIAESKEVRMAVTAPYIMTDSSIQNRTIHFVNSDTYVNTELGFLEEIAHEMAKGTFRD